MIIIHIIHCSNNDIQFRNISCPNSFHMSPMFDGSVDISEVSTTSAGLTSLLVVLTFSLPPTAGDRGVSPPPTDFN